MRPSLVAILVLVAGCAGSSSSSTPEDAGTAFVEAVDAGDCDAVRRTVLTPSELECTVVDGYRSLLGGVDPQDADVAETSRTGTSAVVEVAGAPEPFELQLQRVDGAWKVVVDSAA